MTHSAKTFDRVAGNPAGLVVFGFLGAAAAALLTLAPVTASCSRFSPTASRARPSWSPPRSAARRSRPPPPASAPARPPARSAAPPDRPLAFGGRC